MFWDIWKFKSKIFFESRSCNQNYNYAHVLWICWRISTISAFIIIKIFERKLRKRYIFSNFRTCWSKEKYEYLILTSTTYVRVSVFKHLSLAFYTFDRSDLLFVTDLSSYSDDERRIVLSFETGQNLYYFKTLVNKLII